MKTWLTAFATFFLPSAIMRPFLRLLGHKVGKGARIGFSFVKCPKMILEANSRLGHLNLIMIPELQMGENSSIGYLNIFKGPFSAILHPFAAIGQKNYLTRGGQGVSFGESHLQLGTWSKITAGHHIDLTRSIEFGEYSILAGLGSQMWTHGYYHGESGIERIRIDGSISIGDNVYVGSACVFNPGVQVGNAIHLGGGTVISKDLKEKGMYVGQGLRFVPNNIDAVRTKLDKAQVDSLVDEVYLKE